VIGEKTVLTIIPARGGSKGVPRKNIREVGGKPLIAWTIEEAKKSQYIDRLILSSDDAEIIEIALKWGCEVPFVRPSKLGCDDTPGIDPVIHAIKTLPEKYDLVVLLQATSPLRTVEDIDGCILRLIEYNSKACVSVVEPDKSPYWMYRFDEKNQLVPLLEQGYVRRQDLPKIYALNGAVYVAECLWLENTKSFISPETIGYIMPPERSLDVDSEQDIVFCEAMISGSN
jgi:N-acylneuraminate cytidylyltransferase